MSHWLACLTTSVIVALTFCGQAEARSLQSGECNWCYHCTTNEGEDGIATFEEGVTPWYISYLHQPDCMPYKEGCENLIECQPHTDSHNLPDLLDRGDLTGFADTMRERPDQIELVPSRNVVLFRNGCSRVEQLRELAAHEMRYLLSQQE